MQQVKEEEPVRYLEDKYVQVDEVPKVDAEWMYWHGWGGDLSWPLPKLVAQCEVAGRYCQTCEVRNVGESLRIQFYEKSWPFS